MNISNSHSIIINKTILEPDVFEWDWRAEDGHMAPYIPIEELHDSLRVDGWIGPTCDIFHPEKGVWFKRHKKYKLIIKDKKPYQHIIEHKNIIEHKHIIEHKTILEPDVFEWEWRAEDGHMAPYTPIEDLHDSLKVDGWIGPTCDIFHPEKGVWFKRYSRVI